MSEDRMEAPSTPSHEVRGPNDLRVFMNESTSEKWEGVPLPARQQLGYHERLVDAKSGNGINEFFGKSAADLRGAVEQVENGDNTRSLSSFVGYHLEATEPPAEPAGAPGTAGYNQVNRGVPAAEGYELDVEHTLTNSGNARVLQFAPDQGLSPEEQAKVDGAGPFVPAKALTEYQDEVVQGTANGVLHGHPETFEVAPGGTKKAAAAAAGAPKVTTEDDLNLAETGDINAENPPAEAEVDTPQLPDGGDTTEPKADAEVEAKPRRAGGRSRKSADDND